MELKEPTSMDELIYFTRRTIEIDEKEGKVRAWAFKKECPKCHKGLMGKPVEKGKVKVRADYYVCPECGYEEKKAEYEKEVKVNIEYECPYCSHKGKTQIPYKRKNWQGVQAFVFECEECGKKTGITKKMKDPKTKK